MGSARIVQKNYILIILTSDIQPVSHVFKNTEQVA